MPTIKNEWVLPFAVSRDTNWIARVRCTQSAAVHCWHAVGMAAAKAYCSCRSFHKEECCSMRVHIDRKQLDGDAIAVVVITLLIVIAFAYQKPSGMTGFG